MRYIIILSMLLSGCASQEAHNKYLESFNTSSTNYYDASKLPILDLTLPAPEGKEYHLVVHREVKQMIPQQIKDSEWVQPVNKLIGAGAMVGGMYMMKQDPVVVTQPQPIIVRPEIIQVQP